MKTLLITGGTDGIGKALVFKFLKEGYEIIAVGSSSTKGENLLKDTKSIRSDNQLTFLQANLTLVSENRRVISVVKKKWDHLDALILCAANLKPRASYQETEEGLEFTFALYYLSRYVLSHEMTDMLDKSPNPFILNVAAPGMKGEVNWKDIQFKASYDGSKVQFHGSRLNDLLGVYFTDNYKSTRIRYILFNPMAARTNGASQMASGISGLFMKLYYQIMGKEPTEIAEIIMAHIHKNHKSGLEAYLLNKPVNLSAPTFDHKNAEKLDCLTRPLVNRL